MPGTIQIDPHAVYTDGSLRLLLDLPSSTLAKARRAGSLRFSRRGKRVYYRGEWILDWLVGGKAKDGGEP
jgi:hypothetical protein